MPDPILFLWYQALQSPFGIIIRGSRSAIGSLYRARSAAADPDLHTISIIQHPRDPDLLILARISEAESALRARDIPISDLEIQS